MNSTLTSVPCLFKLWLYKTHCWSLLFFHYTFPVVLFLISNFIFVRNLLIIATRASLSLFKRGRKKHLLHFLMIYFYCISFVTTCRPAVLSSHIPANLCSFLFLIILFRWFSFSYLTLSLFEIYLSLQLELRFRYGIALRNPFPQNKPNDIIYLHDFMNLGCCFLLLVRHPPCCSYSTEQFSKNLLSNIGFLVQNDEYNFYALTIRFRKYFAKKKTQLNYEQYTNVSSLFVQIMTFVTSLSMPSSVFIIQSQEIKYIIQTSKQVTTIQYICPTGSQSYLWY
jgi:hypothetical protein